MCLDVYKILQVLSRGILNVYNNKSGPINIINSSDHTIIDVIKNSKTVFASRKRNFFKHSLKELAIAIDKDFIHKRLFELHLNGFEQQEIEKQFEDLDTYHRLHIYKHLALAPPTQQIFGVFDNMLSIKNIYKQILYHKSYVRFRQQLLYLVNHNPSEAKDDKLLLIQFCNNLCLIE
jgi:hypothetical protein